MRSAFLTLAPLLAAIAALGPAPADAAFVGRPAQVQVIDIPGTFRPGDDLRFEATLSGGDEQIRFRFRAKSRNSGRFIALGEYLDDAGLLLPDDVGGSRRLLGPNQKTLGLRRKPVNFEVTHYLTNLSPAGLGATVDPRSFRWILRVNVRDGSANDPLLWDGRVLRTFQTSLDNGAFASLLNTDGSLAITPLPGGALLLLPALGLGLMARQRRRAIRTQRISGPPTLG